MDKHGRLTEDYGNLRHHHAGPGERLTMDQRKDNARYNAAVHARGEMLGTFGSSVPYTGNSSISDSSVKMRNKAKKVN